MFNDRTKKVKKQKTLKQVQGDICVQGNNQHPSKSTHVNETLSRGEGWVGVHSAFTLEEADVHAAMPPIRVKFAFTLAEVLITLGVIGVVAAMTIPGLMTAYKAHQLRSQFLKSYSTVQQAFKQMEADDVSLDPKDYGSNTGEKYYQVMARYLKPAQLCFRTNLNFPCYDYNNPKIQYTNYLGHNPLNYSFFDDGQIALLDGTLLLLESPNDTRTWVIVDLNGSNKLPNRLGYDVFVFQFLDGELRTMGDKKTAYTDLNRFCDFKSSEALNGIACAQKAKEDTSYFKKLIKEFK